MAKNEILFREGDAPDALYVVKSGRIAITKSKGSGEIVLAEKGAGEMLGEMAFFDSKPRSATAKALSDKTEVVQLPFTALHAQFKTFPEWLRAIVKTVNSHLRDANARIKNLETVAADADELFPPHLVTKLIAVISFMGYKCGKKVEGQEGLEIPYPLLREYCIQVFQQPTNKLDKLMEYLQGLGHMKFEDIGEGRKRVVIVRPEFINGFSDWYYKYLFTEESKRITVEEKEMPAIKALLHYGRQQTPNEKGEVKVSLTDMQNNSMRDLGYLFNANDADSLSEKKLVQEKASEAGNVLTMKFILKDLEAIYPYWEFITIIKKARK